MPLPITLAHRLAEPAGRRCARTGTVPYLRPDGKTQVTIEYDGDQPVRLDTVVVSTPARRATSTSTTLLAPDIREHVVDAGARRRSSSTPTDYRLLVNPTGRFEIGGPMGDAGLTGRKIIVDTYGGMARHGGGAFSGKDPSKVDRSAAYAMRWVAKNVVAAGLADRCEVQVAYAIGKAAAGRALRRDASAPRRSPTSRSSRPSLEVFDLRPAAIIRDLDLLRPIYAQTAAYGHFGRDCPTSPGSAPTGSTRCATPSAPDRRSPQLCGQRRRLTGAAKRRTRSRNPFRPRGVTHPGGLLLPPHVADAMPAGSGGYGTQPPLDGGKGTQPRTACRRQ